MNVRHRSRTALHLWIWLPLVIAMVGCEVHYDPLIKGSAEPTVTMQASPAMIIAGSSSTLTITAMNATQVTVAGSDGSSYSLPAIGGTQMVSPTTTTTYTATAIGDGGKATATSTVNVSQAVVAPTVTLTASVSSIVVGASSTLTVTAANATTVTLTGSDGSSYSLAAAGGAQSVSPTATTTYTATATGSGGTSSAAIVVTVTGAPTVTITADPASIASGGSSTLTVVATNATLVTLSGSDGSSYSMSPTGGMQVVSPAASTSYTASATESNAAAAASVTVTVTEPALSALVYVASLPNLSGVPLPPSPVVTFAADGNGQLTQVGSRALPTGESLAAVSGNAAFTIDSTAIHTHIIDSNGAVGSETSRIDTQHNPGSECGTNSGNSFIDRTGKYLTVELFSSAGNNVCDGWQTYKISSSGALTFMGDYGKNDPQTYSGAGADQLGISTVVAGNHFVYGITSNQENIGFTSFNRSSSGVLAANAGFLGVDPLPNPTANGWLAPVLMAADSTNHLAVLLHEGEFQGNSNMLLASYTVDSATGDLHSTNTVAELPPVAVPCANTMAISPSGELLAIGAWTTQSNSNFGLQVFHFNGADPATPFGGTLLPGFSVGQVAWDRGNHLYAVGQLSGKSYLHVFAVTATSITEVTGSPWSVPARSANLIVISRSPGD